MQLGPPSNNWKHWAEGPSPSVSCVRYFTLISRVSDGFSTTVPLNIVDSISPWGVLLKSFLCQPSLSLVCTTALTFNLSDNGPPEANWTYLFIPPGFPKPS